MDTVTFKGNVMHLEGSQPAVGGKAPDFTLTANDMSPRSLKDYAGKVLPPPAVAHCHRHHAFGLFLSHNKFIKFGNYAAWCQSAHQLLLL